MRGGHAPRAASDVGGHRDDNGEKAYRPSDAISGLAAPAARQSTEASLDPHAITGGGAAYSSSALADARLIAWGGWPNVRRKDCRMRSLSPKPVSRATTSIG